MPTPEAKNSQALRNRFGLSNGKIASPYTYKNLWWEIDGQFFGYGDISPEDVFRIKSNDIMMHGDIVVENNKGER